MHLGLVTLEQSGHLNPSLSLAREVARQGHRVSFISSPRARAKVEKAGFELLPIGEKEREHGNADALLARLATLRGISAGFVTARLLARLSEVSFRDLPGIYRDAKFDGLIIDQACPAAAMVAERLEQPYVVICNALALHYDPVSPPIPTLWRYRTDFPGRHRNRLLMAVVPPVFDLLTGATRAGASPLWLSFADPPRGLAHIAQQPAFFDFPRIGLPEHFHYTSPWHEPARDDDLDFPWDRLDGRPLIYASLGTIQNNLRYVFAAIIEAVRGLDAQVVLSFGRVGATFDLPTAENVIVVPFAPQIRLLERATLAITHAGLNTALECLAQGVPMLCLPVTNDQPGVSRRVEWIGAGRLLPIRRVTANRLRSALAEMLTNPAYRQSATRHRDTLAATDGPLLAARIIERAFGKGERVRRRDWVRGE